MIVIVDLVDEVDCVDVVALWRDVMMCRLWRDVMMCRLWRDVLFGGFVGFVALGMKNVK